MDAEAVETYLTSLRIKSAGVLRPSMVARRLLWNPGIGRKAVVASAGY